jgi:hypothetical protein
MVFSWAGCHKAVGGRLSKHGVATEKRTVNVRAAVGVEGRASTPRRPRLGLQ